MDCLFIVTFSNGVEQIMTAKRARYMSIWISDALERGEKVVFIESVKRIGAGWDKIK